jgi:hypothetical protein
MLKIHDYSKRRQERRYRGTNNRQDRKNYLEEDIIKPNYITSNVNILIKRQRILGKINKKKVIQ